MTSNQIPGRDSDSLSSRIIQETSPVDTSAASVSQSQEPSQLAKGWAEQRGLDNSHAQLHELLHFMNPELGSGDINEIRNLVFTNVVSTTLEGKARCVGKKK